MKDLIAAFYLAGEIHTFYHWILFIDPLLNLKKKWWVMHENVYYLYIEWSSQPELTTCKIKHVTKL